MKYKRQLVGGMFALSLFTAGNTAFANSNEMNSSKFNKTFKQVKMKSYESNKSDNSDSVKKSKKALNRFK